jgi:RimJ/RimL family protein N-acetyltransferase
MDLTYSSLRGKTTTLESSRDWMVTQLKDFDNYLYAIHTKSDLHRDAPGTLIGSCGLRIQGDLEHLPSVPQNPHLVFSSHEKDPHTPLKPILFRTLGYALFESAWGKGYATETISALMASFKILQSSVRERAKEEGKEDVWTFVKAEVDDGNPASKKVMDKLGFENMGKAVVEDGKMIFLGGQWRDPVYWVYGRWV